MVIHFLGFQDNDVTKLGATSGTDGSAQALSWTRLESDETVYGGVRAWVGCEIIERIPAGKSTVLIAQTVGSHIAGDMRPCEARDALAYHNCVRHQLGEHSIAKN